MDKPPFVEHELTPDCWCKPVLDDDKAVNQVWIHNETALGDIPSPEQP